jgi:galactokinase
VRDLPAALLVLKDPVSKRRTRHVVTENQRVLRVVNLLITGKFAEIGPELTASHISLRDDYEVSSPELNLAVETALAQGALGARMIGGGFGGSTIALIPTDLREQISKAISHAFEHAGFESPEFYLAVPSRGAHKIS